MHGTADHEWGKYKQEGLELTIVRDGVGLGTRAMVRAMVDVGKYITVSGHLIWQVTLYMPASRIFKSQTTSTNTIPVHHQTFIPLFKQPISMVPIQTGSTV